MNNVIDLGPELLVDASLIRDPYVRLLTAALGQKLVRGSPWVALNKAALGCVPVDGPAFGNAREGLHAGNPFRPPRGTRPTRKDRGNPTLLAFMKA